MMTVRPFPTDFAHKGEYRSYDSSWNQVGYTVVAEYPGQLPVRFPEDATPLECALGGYLR